MSSYLPLIVIGIASGSAYALVSVGLVLTYKATGVFNFAQGSTAMVGAFAYYSFSVDMHLPAPAAIALTLFVVAPIAGALLDLLLRQVGHSSPAAQIVATLGVSLTLQGLADNLYGATPRQVASFLPTSIAFRIADLNVRWDQVWITVIAAGAAIVLAGLYAYTDMGLRTRGLVDNRELTTLEGSSISRLTRTSWVIGSVFAALAGVLLVPLVGLDSSLLTLLAVQAFGAAAIGRFRSLPLAYGGAILLGVLSSVATKLTASVPALIGLPTSVPFVVLFIALLLMRAPLTTDGSSKAARKPLAFKTPTARTLLAIACVLLVALPFLIGDTYVLGATGTLIFLLIFAGLQTLSGLTRQVSLCAAAFAGVGAVVVAHLSGSLPFLLVLIIAGVVTIPLAVAVALPAVRLSGLLLALATFGFGILVQQLIFPLSWAFGGAGQVSMDRPTFFGLSLAGDNSYYWFVLVVVGAFVVLLRGVSSGRLGRVSRALADSEIAVKSLGIRPAVPRVILFCLSAVTAAIAGALMTALYYSASTSQFTYQTSLLWIAVLVTSGTLSMGGAMLSAILFATLPVVFTWSWFTTYVDNWQGVFFGVNAIIYATNPEGALGTMRNQALWVGNAVGRLFRRRPGDPDDREPVVAGERSHVTAGQAS